MKNTISRILIMGSLVVLTACGGGGDTVTPAPSTALTLITAFDTTVQTDSVDLANGISTACYASDTAYQQATASIVDSVWSYSQMTYSDADCATSPTAISSFKASLVIDQDVTINGWIDGNGNALTPPPAKASDPSTALSTTVKYTRINVTFTESNFTGINVDDTSNVGFVIDNSSADGVVLYRVNENGYATDADPYTNIPASTGGGGTGGGGTTGGPDIRISIDSVERTDYADSKITYTVINYGNAATGAFQVMGWFDRATAPDYGSAGSGKFNSHSDLAANGGSEQGTVIIDSVTLTTGAALNAYVIADYNQEVGETDEGVTGTDDNMAHKAWTVQDIFVFGTTPLIEKSQSVTISAIYSGSGATTTIRMGDSASSASLQAILTGEIVPGTYSTASGTITQAYVIQSGVTYMTSAIPANSAVSLTIAEGGIVGNVISGTYSAVLCSNWSSFTNCSGVSKTFTGNFSMIRDPDQ